jgi:hypothetical protein
MKPAFATEVTGQAFALASIFKIEFGARDVTGHTPQLSEPQSPSSQSGLLMKQHITLEREGTPAIKVGWLNCAERKALLRTYDRIDQVHHLRYGASRVRLEKRAYADLFLDLASFLRKQSYEVKIEDADPKRAAALVAKGATRSNQPTAPSRAAQLWWLVALVATVAIAAATTWLLRM